MLKENKGITLIALVITIIVLLILAGVTLSLVAGENGILRRATNAVDINEKETAKEQVTLEIANYQTQYYEKKYVDREIESGLRAGEWIYDVCKGKEIEAEDYRFTITTNGEVSEENPYVVRIKKNNKLRTEVTGTLSIDGKLRWDDVKESAEQKEKNLNANAELKDLLAAGDIEMTLEDVLASETMLDKIGKTEAELLESGKSLEKILEEANIDKIGIEDILASEKLLNKIFSNEAITEYLKKEENKETFEKLTSTEVAKDVLKDTNKPLYYETARVDLTLVPSANNTGTVDVSENGEYTLTGNAKLESEEVMNLTTFTFYVEVKDLTRYYNETLTMIDGSFAGLIIGVGTSGSSTQNRCLGISDGWGGNVLNTFSGTGGYPQVSRDLLTSEWNRLAITYDGNELKMYVNGVEEASYNSVQFFQTKLHVGGWSDAPYYASGDNWGFANGTYRNIKVYNVALDADQL